MKNQVEEFNAYRQKMNDKLLGDNNKIIKRIFNLDTNAYTEGALDVKTKELLGLVASTIGTVSPMALELTGLAGWFATQLGVPGCFAVIFSAIAIKFGAKDKRHGGAT